MYIGRKTWRSNGCVEIRGVVAYTASACTYVTTYDSRCFSLTSNCVPARGSPALCVTSCLQKVGVSSWWHGVMVQLISRPAPRARDPERTSHAPLCLFACAYACAQLELATRRTCEGGNALAPACRVHPTMVHSSRRRLPVSVLVLRQCGRGTYADGGLPQPGALRDSARSPSDHLSPVSSSYLSMQTSMVLLLFSLSVLPETSATTASSM